jgi:hypothetical protein
MEEEAVHLMADRKQRKMDLRKGTGQYTVPKDTHPKYILLPTKPHLLTFTTS